MQYDGCDDAGVYWLVFIFSLVVRGHVVAVCVDGGLYCAVLIVSLKIINTLSYFPSFLNT